MFAQPIRFLLFQWFPEITIRKGCVMEHPYARVRRFHSLALALLFALLPLGGLVTTPVEAASWRVTVRGHGSAAGETPVFTKITAEVPPGDYILTPEKTGAPITAHLFELAGTRYLGTVLKSVPREGSVSFVMEPDTKSELTRPGVELRPEGGNLHVLVGGKPLMVYRADEPTKPYYYPVIGPTGAAITRAYPMLNVDGEDHDHPHQRSFWFSHGNVNGYDFWASDPVNSPNPKFGKIKETSRKATAGSAVGLIQTTDQWLGPDGKMVCEDERIVRIYDTNKGRTLDVDVTIKASAGPVTFGDTKEGMFGVRVASTMDVKNKKGGKITNAEGLTDDAAWGKASRWVDYTGTVEGKTVGIAILNHPNSFRYPTTWHVRTYGLFAANPFGWHDFGQKDSGAHMIPAGESLRFRYRVLLHEGDTDSAKIPDAFKSYAEPPTIEIKAE